MNDNNQKISFRKFLLNPITLLLVNITLSIVVSFVFLNQLKRTSKKFTFINQEERKASNNQQHKDSIATIKSTSDSFELADDSSASVKVVKTATKDNPFENNIKTSDKKNEKNTLSNPLDFYQIIKLMLLSGVLGGILCNLRGFFIFYLKINTLPNNLLIPYYIRPFTGAISGLFIYFVASLLVTSITLENVATSISFQGMLSYIALAILAGFGSQEFMERLKALVVTFFGQQQNQDRRQELENYKSMLEEGLITENQFELLKKKLYPEFFDESVYSDKDESNTDKAKEANKKSIRTISPPLKDFGFRGDIPLPRD